MAAPQKNGLDYFPFEVGFFSDKKIKRLRARFGNDGVCILLYLYAEMYRDGFYIIYDDDLILDISDELNISENLTRQVIDHLLSRTMLTVCEINNGGTLAKPVKVLTAKSVQKRYQFAKKGCKRNVFVEAGCWLLEKSETFDFIKMHPKNNYSENNADNSEKNPNNSENNTTKYSKVKDSKVKENIDISADCTNKFVPPQTAPADTVKTKRFVRPTLEEIQEYCRERKNSVDPQRFLDYYESNGWKVGKNAMKDWRAAVRTWERNGYGNSRNNYSGYSEEPENGEFSYGIDVSKF